MRLGELLQRPSRVIRSHCHLRNRGADSLREPGIKWTDGRAKRPCDPPRRVVHWWHGQRFGVVLKPVAPADGDGDGGGAGGVAVELAVERIRLVLGRGRWAVMIVSSSHTIVHVYVRERLFGESRSGQQNNDNAE
jgi:hypothetical protein